MTFNRLFALAASQANAKATERIMTTRTLRQVIRSVPTSDGAGVKLRRSLGSAAGLRHDPFLMLDEFSSENPGDYIAGFPAHPHRGFETVTYLLDGHMLHEDHLGHRGDLKSGGVQWMTAGRGIIHSEMPQQLEGRMRGFQLWINLPAKEKMKPASYRDIDPSEIPAVRIEGGGTVKAIAGTVRSNGAEVTGPVGGLTTDPLYLDVELPANAVFEQAVETSHNAFLYVFEGSVAPGPDGEERPLETHHAGLLSGGEVIRVKAGARGGRFLLLAGKPIGEPIVQYGPFVMNTREEIEQAIRDYQNGELAA
jgi:redox-sensitive bicupin YhaK (pirin superfamily)